MRTRVYRVSRVPEGGSVGGLSDYLNLLKTNLLPYLGLLEYGRVRCVLPPGPALRRARMRGRRSEYAEFPRGGRPRARPSAPGRPYSHTAPPGAERLLGRVRPGTRACDSCTLSFGREHDLQS